jgi:hypothetical protein
MAIAWLGWDVRWIHIELCRRGPGCIFIAVTYQYKFTSSRRRRL